MKSFFQRHKEEDCVSCRRINIKCLFLTRTEYLIFSMPPNCVLGQNWTTNINTFEQNCESTLLFCQHICSTSLLSTHRKYVNINQKSIQSAQYRTSHAYFPIQTIRALQFILSRGLLKIIWEVPNMHLPRTICLGVFFWYFCMLLEV